MLFYKNLILHQYINTYLVDDILRCDRMAEKEEEQDFATLLIKWYLEQKRGTKGTTTSDKVDSNVRKEI